jgi:pilus assembly protein CpaE
MSSEHILVVEDSETTLLKLKLVLGYFGYQVTTHSDPQAALDWLMATKQIPDLILSDVLMPGLSGIEFTQKVRGMPALAKIPIVLMTADTDAEIEAAGRKAGADKYLNKMLSAGELSNQIKTILESHPDPTLPQEEAPHRMVTLFSLRGGAGTTSLAVNLTIALKQLWGGETVLWDMALSTGHCGLMLDLAPDTDQVAWTEGLGEDHQAADLLTNHDSGIKVIQAPASLSHSESIPGDGVDQIWPAVRDLANYLVVDGGHHFTEPIQKVLRNSDKVLLLLGPDVPSIKSASDALEKFDKLGIGPDKFELILNNTILYNQVNKKVISSSLGKPLLAEIPYDSQNFSRAISCGKPLLTAAPTSESGLALMLLAYLISKKDMESKMGDYTTPLLHKVRQLEWENEAGLVKW